MVIFIVFLLPSSYEADLVLSAQVNGKAKKRKELRNSRLTWIREDTAMQR